MKKFSLKFLDQKTENEYQESRNLHFRQPIFKYSHYGMMIISIIKLIIDIYGQDYSGLFAIIATQIYIALSLLIVKFRVVYIQLALILFNYSLIIYEWKLSATISQEAIPLFTNSFSICHIMFFLVLDIFESYILIVTTMLFKLIYTIMFDSQMSINIYVATCVLMGFLCYCSRRLNYQSRSNFLMSQKEDLWNKILPQIVDQPFVLFTFNNEKIEFQYQYSKQIDFPCQNTLDLKNFLRNSFYQNKTIEEIFFYICQKSQNTENQFETLEIQYLKVQYKITYSIFYYQQPLILIKFQNDHSQIENRYRITQQKSKKQQFKLLQFFQKNLQLYIQNQDLSKVIFLRNLCYKHILNYVISKKNHKLLTEKLEYLLHPLIELFEYKNIDLYYQKDEIKNLNTVKIYFRRLFYEIFLNCKKNSRIQIISFQNTLIIFYSGKQINCKPNDVLNLVINSLVKSQSRVSCNQIKLELHQDPLLSFK